MSADQQPPANEPMKPERWKKIERIFQHAIESAPAERAAFLDQACAGDQSLRMEIESLIKAEAQADNFIESPAAFPRDQSGSMEGQRIGPYQIIREIGRGGMGKVLLASCADDGKVAVKLIRRGMDSEHILRRFQNEREILAALDHSYIARLLDGGTAEDGSPYLVMEYIAGEPLIDYCDVRRLNITERLKLFRNVCSAVHYAHQKHIVHRDIKPGNILVTADGVVKLLDFGIAKLLRPDSLSQSIALTPPGMRLMTLNYASPEQVKAEAITTASDVYSLGVVLYELLTGHWPYRRNSDRSDEVIRAICDDEPEAPSVAVARVEQLFIPGSTSRIITPESVSETREGEPDSLRRRLSGDLDNIVVKALRKHPQQRYASVELFSDDISHHLERSSAMACRETMEPAAYTRRVDSSDRLELKDGFKTSVIDVSQLRAMLAPSPDIPAEADAEAWREARSCYQRCSDILAEMRTRGLLKGSDAQSLDEIARRIAAQIVRCDAALRKSNIK